jgi:hypothetical protein
MRNKLAVVNQLSTFQTLAYNSSIATVSAIERRQVADVLAIDLR